MISCKVATCTSDNTSSMKSTPSNTQECQFIDLYNGDRVRKKMFIIFDQPKGKAPFSVGQVDRINMLPPSQNPMTEYEIGEYQEPYRFPASRSSGWSL